MIEKTTILSIETSADICSVCLSANEKVTLEYNSYEKNMHDELLAEFTRRILNDAHHQIQDLSAIAISAGPGSFTGLRIGAAFAKALCFEDNPKFIAVPTLEAIASNFLQIASNVKKTQISALIPSHKDLIYQQDFDLNGNYISDIVTISKDDLIENLSENSFYCGPAAQKLNLSSYGKYNNPVASIIAKVAYKYYLENNFDDAEKFVPHYIQEFVPKKSTKQLNI
jgi:tRNA threonylcarbamoyladenosine biosynthesis protein TsaB